jgi:hypothetical protein
MESGRWNPVRRPSGLANGDGFEHLHLQPHTGGQLYYHDLLFEALFGLLEEKQKLYL